ncbi:MAG: cytidine deaminase [Sphaerochaetaceae bacterium]|nr:cytidine deaminase [Sphaerochaetaceae bacterium]
MINQKQLMETAIEAREHSYAPYSNFCVGAALMTNEGKVYTGCNIENSGFTATVCAERVAFFKAVEAGERDFKQIAIVGGMRGPITDSCAPCGVCRQVMAEFCNHEKFKIILGKNSDVYKVYTLAELLPLSVKADESPLVRGFMNII